MAEQIVIGTSYIDPDELCYGLYELDYQSPGNKGMHRYQIIQVNRDGKIAEYRKDMGLARKFKNIDQLRLPCLWEHKVGEAKDIADWARSHLKHDKKELAQTNKVRG